METSSSNAATGTRSVPVHQRFLALASQTPDAGAAVDGRGAQLTYGDLAARAKQLSNHLVERGARPGDRIALALERSFETLVAVVAILDAGCAYMPLEWTYPGDRLAFMLGDAGVRLVVTQSSLRARLPAASKLPVPCEVIELDRDADRIARASDSPHASLGPDDVAYVMYTSGSTGTPKGVEIVHRAIERLVIDPGYCTLDASTVVLHAAPLAFDASTFELWGALANGGRIVLYPDAVPTARGLREAITRHGVTTMWLTAALFNAVVDDDATALHGLRELLTGGEALSVSHVRRALKALPTTTLINGYGPTETTTFACCYRIPRALEEGAKSIPIGLPIRETTAHVLDAALRPVARGDVGELYLGGAGLARGYLGREQLTRERFVPSPFVPSARLYRTGDLVVEQSDGLIDYVARADAQVKIRGFRIELGEIESALLAHESVGRAVVVAREDGQGAKRLVAYLVPKDPAQTLAIAAIRAGLAASLPDYMVPAAFVTLAAIPVTTNGKLDARALPAPSTDRPELANALAMPAGGDEVALAGLWSELLGVSPVGATDNFFELGGTSLLAMRMMARLRAERGIDAPIVALFEHPTVRGLLQAVRATGAEAGSALEARLTREAHRALAGRGPIAIVGMVGRYPGAPDLDAFWSVLAEGRETITRFTDAELDPSIPTAVRNDPAYVKARGVLDGVDMFDARFFGIQPKEAAIMDPQQRILLEMAWSALEHAGHVPESFDGTIGVFAGKYNDSYWSENVVTRPDLIEGVGAFQAMVANEKDYIATRIAHRLDLTGPAISLHTACSTSLVAIASAVRSLQSGDCDLALAGGVSITVPVKSGHLHQEGAMLSSDGSTRTFDAEATGTVFSDGAGLVVLRRLEDATRDGDTIWGVIRGVAVNNDGGKKASFTAPSVEGQATVIARAHADAGVDPRSIGYVEAHGTATPLGDPIEVEALTRAFRARTSEVGFCGLGSIKSNFGHTVIAAGVAGVIKTALALVHEEIPATLFQKSPNPTIDFSRSPFRVLAASRPWPRAHAPRRAGVSSFGVGGTNAHVIVEEAPSRVPAKQEGAGAQLLVLSARTPEALAVTTSKLADHLEQRDGEQSLADVAFTLHVGRRAFPHRRTVTCTDARDAVAQLRQLPAASSARTASTTTSVAFLFPGQGAQYVGMGSALYAREPDFRAAFDRCTELLTPHLGLDLRLVMHPAPDDTEGASAALRETRITQPALFVLAYALSNLWESWGVTPGAMVGHSVGEIVAAHLAGVFTLEDALALVATRGRLMQSLPTGSMLSVREPAETVRARWTDPELAIASDNGPSLCVVAGPTPKVEALARHLEAEGVVTRPLVTSHAFHSPMMDAVIAPMAAIVAKMTLAPPRIPFVSTVTGTWITDEQATDPMYWARHARETVRFADAVKALWATADLLLEVGPRQTLSTLARQQVVDRATQAAVASLSDDPTLEEASLKRAAGELWTRGVALRAARLHGQARRRVPLPTYPFERQRFWIDRASASAPIATPSPDVALEPATLTKPTSRPPTEDLMAPRTQTSSPRPLRLASELRQLFEETSGAEIGEADSGVPVPRAGARLAPPYPGRASGLQGVRREADVPPAARELFDDRTARRPPRCATTGGIDDAVDRCRASSPRGLAVSCDRDRDARSSPVDRRRRDAPARDRSAASDHGAAIDHARRRSGHVAPVAATPSVTAPAPAAIPSSPVATTVETADPLAESHAKYDVKKAFGAIARIHTHRRRRSRRSNARASTPSPAGTTRGPGSPSSTRRTTGSTSPTHAS